MEDMYFKGMYEAIVNILDNYTIALLVVTLLVVKNILWHFLMQ